MGGLQTPPFPACAFKASLGQAPAVLAYTGDGTASLRAARMKCQVLACIGVMLTAPRHSSLIAACPVPGYNPLEYPSQLGSQKETLHTAPVHPHDRWTQHGLGFFNSKLLPNRHTDLLCITQSVTDTQVHPDPILEGAIKLQRGWSENCGVSLTGDTEEPSGHNPVPSALGQSYLSREVGPNDPTLVLSNVTHSVILWSQCLLEKRPGK